MACSDAAMANIGYRSSLMARSQVTCPTLELSGPTPDVDSNDRLYHPRVNFLPCRNIMAEIEAQETARFCSTDMDTMSSFPKYQYPEFVDEKMAQYEDMGVVLQYPTLDQLCSPTSFDPPSDSSGSLANAFGSDHSYGLGNSQSMEDYGSLTFPSSIDHSYLPTSENTSWPPALSVQEGQPTLQADFSLANADIEQQGYPPKVFSRANSNIHHDEPQSEPPYWAGEYATVQRDPHSISGMLPDDEAWSMETQNGSILDDSHQLENIGHDSAAMHATCRFPAPACAQEVHSLLSHEFNQAELAGALTGLEDPSSHWTYADNDSSLRYLPQPEITPTYMAKESTECPVSGDILSQYSLTAQAHYQYAHDDNSNKYGNIFDADAGGSLMSAEATSQAPLSEPSLSIGHPLASNIGHQLPLTKMEKVNFILTQRQKGKSYKEIKEKAGFTEAESTLRGMVRNTTKRKEQRPRKPIWTARDISILRTTVALFLSNSPGYHSLRSGGLTSIATRAGERALQKLPWKQIAAHMAHRGCHLYGNATVKKKYIEVMGYTMVRQGLSAKRSTRQDL